MSRVTKNSKDNSMSFSASTSNAWKSDKDQGTHISANDSHSHSINASTINTNNDKRSTSADRRSNNNNNSSKNSINTIDKIQTTSPDAWVKEFATLSNYSSASLSLTNLQPWLYLAYRFNVSCPHGIHFPQHLISDELFKDDNAKGKVHNCTSFPMCLAGLQTLRTSSEALHACACALVGPIPAMYEVPYNTENEKNEHSVHSFKKNNCASESYENIRVGNNNKLSEAHLSQPSVCLWRGSRNLSNTCYLNSVLQLLFGVAPVRRAILHEAMMNEQACKNKLHNSLHSSFSSSSPPHLPNHQNVNNAHTTVHNTDIYKNKDNGSFRSSNNNNISISVDERNNKNNKDNKEKQTESHHHKENHHHHNNNKNHESSSSASTEHVMLSQHISPLQESGLPEIFAEMAYSLIGAGADPAILAQYLSLDVTIQQDAQEFLLLLLDWLRTHCSSEVSSTLDRTFCGTLLYDRQCDACGRCSTRAEVLCPLSLPVASTLEECLEQFLQPEKVDGFNCEGCKSTSTSATSRQYLRRLPPVLLIHLNHFVFDEKDMQRRKIGTSVAFPQLLDLTSYMQRWHDDQKRHKAAHELKRQKEQKLETEKQPSHKEESRKCTSAAADADDDAVDMSDATTSLSHAATHAENNNNNVSCKYELRGILNHLGPTALYGHYTYQEKVPIRVTQSEECVNTSLSTAIDKGNVQEAGHVQHKVMHQLEEQQEQEEEKEEYVWLEFNDNEVNEMRLMRSSHVTSKDAYVLVYHRIDDQGTNIKTYHNNINTHERTKGKDKASNSKVNTFAPATRDEFPHYALHHVRQKNTHLLKRRQEWQDEVQNVFVLLQKWAAAAECVFTNQISSEKLLLQQSANPTPVTSSKAMDNVAKEKQETVLANNTTTSANSQRVNQKDENSNNSSNNKEICVVPTFWLKAFGNAFLPPYIATSKFGEEPEHDEHEINEIHNSSASHEYPLGKVDQQEETTTTAAGSIRLSSFVGSVVSNSSLCNNKETSSALNDNDTIINTGMIMLADGANKYLLSQPLSLLCSAHHKLLPLSDYKVISVNAQRAIVEYMNACRHVLSQIEHLKTTQSTIKQVHIAESYTNTSHEVQVPCLMEVQSNKVTDTLCVSCVRDYACMIEKVSAAITEDKKMNVKLMEVELGIEPTRKTTCGSSAATTTIRNDKATHVDEKDANNKKSINEYDSVYVSEKVVEMWAKYIKEIEKAEKEMNEPLDTRLGVIHFMRREIARHASQNQQSHSLAMLPFATLVKQLSNLLSTTLASESRQAMNEAKTITEEILCPHGTLKVESVVKSVPLFMYKYWLKRFAQLVADAHTFTNNMSSNNKNSSNSCFAEIVKQHTNQVEEDEMKNTNEKEKAMKAVEEIIVEHILPLLPANSTKRCELCVRSVVEATANRHHMKLLKMEEARRFPTLWAAGKLTSPSAIANLLAETHLESSEQLLLAKHPNKDYFKRPIKQAYRDAVKSWKEEQEYKIHRMKNTLEFLSTKAEKNRALYLPISESRGRRRNQRRDNVPNATPPPPPDPHTLEGRIYRLQKDLEHLQAELESPPVKVEELFGCLPTAWVADWYAYIVEGKSHHHHHDRREESEKNENDSDSESDSGDDDANIDDNNNNNNNNNNNRTNGEKNKKTTEEKAKTQTKAKSNKRKEHLHVPLIDFDKYVCPEHHKCLMELQWLNPADSFWQGGKMKQAHLLWNLKNNKSSLNNNHTSRNEWLYYTPPLLIVPLTEYVEVLRQYGTLEMLTEKVEMIEEHNKSVVTNTRGGEAHEQQHHVEKQQKESEKDATTKPKESSNDNKAEVSSSIARKVTYEVNEFHVITLLERNGERELQPHPCTPCALHMLSELTHQAAYFTFGTLHLQLHLRKSKKQFYDAESTMSSKQINETPEIHHNQSVIKVYTDNISNTEKSNQVDHGIHHFTTLAKLRSLIAEHIFHYHHYSLPEDKLIIMRSRNKPLKVKNKSQEPHQHGSEEEKEKLESTDKSAKVNPMDRCTLFELDVHDGDTLCVNLTDAIAVSCAEDSFTDNRAANSNSNSNNCTNITTINNMSNNFNNSEGKSNKKKKSSSGKSEWNSQGKEQQQREEEEEEEEVWQEIPPELLMEADPSSHYNQQQQQQHIHPSQVSYNSSNSINATSITNSSSTSSNKHHVAHAYGENTFAETKLHGKKSTSHLPGNTTRDHNSSTTHGVMNSGTSQRVVLTPPEPIGVSCPRCTYLNADGMVVCEMCETPLSRQR